MGPGKHYAVLRHARQLKTGLVTTNLPIDLAFLGPMANQVWYGLVKWINGRLSDGVRFTRAQKGRSIINSHERKGLKQKNPK